MNLRSHADAWLAAWNAHDLDAVMACYAQDVDFVACTVVRRSGKADGRLEGKDQLRQHFKLGLELASDLTFTEEAFLVSPAGYALLYQRENGNRVLDVVEVDDAGLAKRVRAFYQDAQH